MRRQRERARAGGGSKGRRNGKAGKVPGYPPLRRLDLTPGHIQLSCSLLEHLRQQLHLLLPLQLIRSPGWRTRASLARCAAPPGTPCTQMLHLLHQIAQLGSQSGILFAQPLQIARVSHHRSPLNYTYNERPAVRRRPGMWTLSEHQSPLLINSVAQAPATAAARPRPQSEASSRPCRTHRRPALGHGLHRRRPARHRQ